LPEPTPPTPQPDLDVASLASVLAALRRAGADPAAIVFGHLIGDAVAEVASTGQRRIFVVDDPVLAGGQRRHGWPF
jgi:hypothetical protein